MVNITESYTTFNADHALKTKGHRFDTSSLKCVLVPHMTLANSKNLNKNLINKCQFLH